MLIPMFWSFFQYFAGQPQASWQSARSALERVPPGEEYIKNHVLNTRHSQAWLTGRKMLRSPNCNRR